jgi:hypothetical protein
MKKFLLIILIILISYLPSIAARETTDLILLYDFTETSGAVISDKSDIDPKLDLTISDPSKVTFLDPGLSVTAATVIKTAVARTKLAASEFTNGFTIEAWIKPLNNTQSGPARIITFSQDSAERNFTFGQAAEHWDMRFRTSDNPGNGSSPSTVTPANSIAATPILQHIIYTRSASGNAKFYIDGVEVATQTISGDLSNWNGSYGFGLFNEISYPTDDRTWLGDIFLVAIYKKALTSAEVTANFDSGYSNLPPKPPVLLPAVEEYGNITGGDTEHIEKVDYKISYEIRGNFYLEYEVWDSDSDGEIEISVNNKKLVDVTSAGNEVWSTKRRVKIKDILLCDDNLENIITFNNTNNPPNSNLWGVRNVSLVKDGTISGLTLYQESTDKDMTIAWDAVVDANYPDIHYDFFLWNQGEEKKYLTGATQQIQVTFQLPRTGLFAFYARTCDRAKTETDRVCSQWSHSALEREDGTLFGRIADPANPGDHIPGKWMIYGHIAAPSGGGVD